MQTIPLFPLHTVLFPGMPVRLHIFEERYRLMIRHCMQANQPFGVVLIQQGLEANGPLAIPYRVGCTARIVEYQTLPDGRMNLIVVGDERFEVLDLDEESQPYLLGSVRSFPLASPSAQALAAMLKRLAGWVEEYLQRLAQWLKDRSFEIDRSILPDDPLLRLYLAAALLQIPNHEKQDLLALPAADELMDGVFRLYRREVALLDHSAAVPEATAERLARWN
ncbi:MAG TPA: LON peptidase substrate-binding domain-containing protein [Anaerolineaceae bacterium]|nr:LON peptidase substrate-binding domain-containing protein [Anaerolineaceae bacterium]